MLDENCSLIFTGQIVDGITLAEVHENLAKIFNADIDKIQAMFSKRESVIKKNADRQKCLKMQEMIFSAGAKCEIITIGSEKDALNSVGSSQGSPVPDVTPAAETSPYAAPLADLKAGNTSENDAFSGPQKRPASHGAAWVLQAFTLFFKSPFKLILTLILYVLVSLIQIIPLIGAIVINLINPALIAGFILGAKSLDEDNEFSPTCIFKGFSHNFGQLFLLGLLFMGSIIVAIAVPAGVIIAFVGVDFASLSNPEAITGSMGIMVLLMVLLILFITMPLMMCYLFAPSLIAINDKPVFEAIKLSFYGCSRNVLPSLVYSLVFLGIFAAVGLVVGILSAVAGKWVLMLIPAIIIIMFMPITMLTIYTSYKDIFYKQ